MIITFIDIKHDCMKEEERMHNIYKQLLMIISIGSNRQWAALITFIELVCAEFYKSEKCAEMKRHAKDSSVYRKF